MKPRDIQVRLTSPCSQSRDNMSESRVGYYCHSCQKDVIDFTTLSDGQLWRVLENMQGKPACGMFRADQLNRSLPAPPAIPLWQWAAGRVAASYMLLQSLVHTAVAQTTKPKALTQQQATPAATDSFVLKGRVIDAYSQLPVDSVMLWLLGYDLKATTNADGYFSFSIPANITNTEFKITAGTFLPDKGFVVEDTRISRAEYKAGKELVLYRYIGGTLQDAVCTWRKPLIDHYGSVAVMTGEPYSGGHVTVIKMWKVWDFFAKPFKRKKHAR